jgi:hypothetical protein
MEEGSGSVSLRMLSMGANLYALACFVGVLLCAFCLPARAQDVAQDPRLEKTSVVPPPYVLPQPTGSYGVGVEEYTWTDRTRPEVLTSNKKDFRRVFVRVFYPAGSTAGLSTAAYMDAWTAKKFWVTKGVKGLGSVQTHTVLNAPAADGVPPFPCLVFSPGQYCPPQIYTALMEDLASHGYVIATVLHPFFSGYYKLSPGAVAKPVSLDRLLSDPTLFPMVVADLRFVLDQLRAVHAPGSGDPLAGRVDWDRVVAFGHSLGGIAVMELALQDDRVSAVLNYDGPLWFGQVGNVGLQKPFLLVQSAEKASDIQWTSSWDVLFQTAPDDAWRALFNGSVHDDFSDLGGDSHIQLTRLVSRTFMGVQMLNWPGSALDDTAVEHPEANLRRVRSSLAIFRPVLRR